MLGRTQRERQRDVRRARRERGHHHGADPAEEQQRRHTAERFQNQRVGDELVEREARQHDRDVGRELPEHLDAEAGGEREEEGGDAVGRVLRVRDRDLLVLRIGEVLEAGLCLF